MSLALCGLAAVQWVREVGLRKHMQQQDNTQHQQEEIIRDLRAGLLQAQTEIRRLEELRTGLSAQAITGEKETVALRRELKQSEDKVAQLIRNSQSYSQALQTANQNIRQANDNIQHQNHDLQQLAEERNTAVKRLKELAQDYSRLTADLKRTQPEPVTNSPQIRPGEPR